MSHLGHTLGEMGENRRSYVRGASTDQFWKDVNEISSTKRLKKKGLASITNNVCSILIYRNSGTIYIHRNACEPGPVKKRGGTAGVDHVHVAADGAVDN